MSAEVPKSDMGVYHTLNRPEPCPLINGEKMRITDSFQLYSRASGKALYGPVPAEPAFAEDFLSRGGQPIIGGYMTLACFSCSLCVPLRTVLPEFNRNADHRRIMGRNTDLTFTFHDAPPEVTTKRMTEHTRVYRAYMIDRFYGGNRKEFDVLDAVFNIMGQVNFPGMTPARIDARDSKERLQGSLMYHTAGKSAYGTMFFHAPKRRATSLGQAMMLACIERLQEGGFDYLYLAHWTRSASPYSWKDNFTPLDAYIDGNWQRQQNKGAMRTLRAGEGPAYPTPKQA